MLPCMIIDLEFSVDVQRAIYISSLMSFSWSGRRRLGRRQERVLGRMCRTMLETAHTLSLHTAVCVRVCVCIVVINVQ